MRTLTDIQVSVSGQSVSVGSTSVKYPAYLDLGAVPGTVQAFDFSVDILQHVIWQYTDDAPMQRLMALKQRFYDIAQRDFWSNWVTNVFDLRTANVFGLYVWAKILNIAITIEDSTEKTTNNFGFGRNHLNFGNGNFGTVNTSTVVISKEQARTLLRLRYYQLVTNGTVTDINRFLKSLWGSSGGCYVVDGLDMTCMYVFKFEPGSKLVTAIKFFDVLPRPAGVKLRKIVTPNTRIFGFDLDNDLYGGFDQSVWG